MLLPHATKNQDTFIQVSEASFLLNQSPGRYQQVRVQKAREAEDEKAFNGVGMGIGTEVRTVKSMDITLNPGQSFLSTANLRKHTFTYEGTTVHHGAEVHAIAFNQKNIRESLYRGMLYLHAQTLAITGYDLSLSEKGLPYARVGNAAERAALRLLNIGITLQAQHITVRYRPYGRAWYLHHVVKHENVRVNSRRYNFDVPVNDRCEFLVTGIDTTFHEPFASETFSKKEFVEGAPDTTADFWENVNILPATTDYSAIAKAIDRRNGYAALKEGLRARLKNLPKNAGQRADSIVSYYHRQGLFNGTALVQRHGQVILHKAYGYANREQHIPNDTSTVFRIGSVSKTFTAYIIVRLAQEGRLQYTDSVQRFLPWYPHRGITLHHLLTHTSGIPNYTGSAAFLDSIRHPYTIEELVVNFGMEPPAFAPGAAFQYSNTGYTLLALIAEKASGETFAALFDQYIVAAAGLRQTTFAQQHAANQATGYWNQVVEPVYAIGNTAGAGAVASSAADLLLWHRHLNTPATAVLFLPRAWYADWGAHYGYGWCIDKYQFMVSKKSVVHYHAGTDFGFKCMFARQPDADNVVVLLNNTGEFPLFDMTDLLLQALN